jgi:hypothetical protein
MATFNFKLNEETGNMEAPFSAELVSISSEPSGETSTNEIPFYSATVKFENAAGQIKTTSALVMQGNVDRADEEGGFVKGQSYLCKAIKDNSRKGVLLVLSHLSPTIGASDDDFGIGEEEVVAKKPAEKKAGLTAKKRMPAAEM